MEKLWSALGLLALLAPPVAAQVTDHLSCHKIQDPLALRGLVDVDAPSIGLSPGCKIRRATKLCVPAVKTVQEATDTSTRPPAPIVPWPVGNPPAASSYVCYKVRCPKDQPPAGEQTFTDQFGARTFTGKRLVELCAPARQGLFIGGTWHLTGAAGIEDCLAPPFLDVLTIVQTGTTLTAFSPRLSFAGSTTATSFGLGQTGVPIAVPCPGGFYDAILNLGGTLDADGSVRVTQTWILTPPVAFPDCPPCSKSWSGEMTLPPAP